MPDSPTYLSFDVMAATSMYGGHISFNKGIFSLFYMLLELEPFITGPASINPCALFYSSSHLILVTVHYILL